MASGGAFASTASHTFGSSVPVTLSPTSPPTPSPTKSPVLPTRKLFYFSKEIPFCSSVFITLNISFCPKQRIQLHHPKIPLHHQQQPAPQYHCRLPRRLLVSCLLYSMPIHSGISFTDHKIFSVLSTHSFTNHKTLTFAVEEPNQLPSHWHC